MSNTGTLYQNQFVPSRRQLRKAYKKILFGISNRQQWLMTAVAVILLAAVLIPPLTRGAEFDKRNAILFWMAVTMLGITCMVCFILPMIFAQITISKMKSGGKEVLMETSFDDQKVCIRNSAATGETVLAYNVFTGLEEIDDLLLLRVGGRQAIILPKDGFTRGNPYGFIKFIRRKLQ